MSESLTHQSLVKHLLDWVSQSAATHKNASIYCDLPTQLNQDNPPEIYGFTPDVFCRFQSSRHIVIGEAKTAKDIETNHTRQQLAAYLRYLLNNGAGQLLVAVPWHSVNRARSLVQFLQRTTTTTIVEVIFLEQLPG